MILGLLQLEDSCKPDRHSTEYHKNHSNNMIETQPLSVEYPVEESSNQGLHGPDGGDDAHINATHVRIVHRQEHGAHDAKE